MPSTPRATVLASNAALPTTTLGPNPTAVFVGATGGIGLGALRALTTHYAKASTPQLTVYIVGRSPQKLTGLIDELKAINQHGTYHAIQAKDLTKVGDALTAAKEILKGVGDTGAVDLLVMSPGYVTFGGREEHPEEGVDRQTAVRYYSRMAFAVTLGPALQRSKAPGGAHVATVLAAGQEGQLWKDDMLLRAEGHYGIVIAGGAGSALNSFFIESLAHKEEWKGVSFAHVYPGVVYTGLEIQGLGAVGNFVLKWLARPVMWFVGYTQEEAGERILYAATSERFARGSEEVGSDGVKGSGAYLLGGGTAIEPASKTMVQLREEGMRDMVYQHTLEVYEKIGKGERV